MSTKLPSFTTDQSNWLVAEVMENSDLLLKNFKQAHDNARKKKKWDELASKANEKFGVLYFTGDKLKRRWETILTQARKRFDFEKRYRSKTGGGAQATEPPTFVRFVIDNFGHKAGFAGITGGIDTSSFASDLDNSKEDEANSEPLPETSGGRDNRGTGNTPTSSRNYRDELLELEIRRSQLEIKKLEEERLLIAEKREALALWSDFLKNSA